MAMNAFITVLLAVALLSVVAVLLTGVVGMAKGGDFNRRYGNKLMRWRVALQGAAVLLIVAAAILARG
jgi:Hypoxia induced protein conserved region